jgi:hypothetical protein
MAKLKVMKINTGVDRQVMSGIGRFLKNTDSALKTGVYGVKRKRRK